MRSLLEVSGAHVIGAPIPHECAVFSFVEPSPAEVRLCTTILQPTGGEVLS